ncbi:MAG: MBL fold hydrolase [Flavobacteriales bacterium]|nr:MBL fold hydrolase [Flavobacteriales bacterium]|tara:strand:+ start:18816 stop:19454 length:639 start_codon:yes stop_codon:yes gene_type:complete
MKIKSFIFNPFQENTYIIYDETKQCIIIDPGCYTLEEQNILKKFITNKKLKPVKLVNTHCHIDHILGNNFVSKEWNIELYIHKEDLPLLDSATIISETYGLKDYQRSPHPKYFLNHGDKLSFGKSSFEVLFTPGHAPGHISLYNKPNNILVVGDVIFKKSIGRTDLPGGSYETLIKTIKDIIFKLPNSTHVLCGHGPSTNLGFEKENNPFLI